jgi:group I intron endonuclease
MPCGVYAIYNHITGLVYVGSSVDIGNRKSQHLDALRRGNHHNPYLQRSFTKYGVAAFSFKVLELCQPEELLCREQAYIDSLQPVYNVRHADEEVIEELVRDKNDWHRWVYGGCRNPINNQRGLR